jgi:hypothetical protein
MAQRIYKANNDEKLINVRGGRKNPRLVVENK